MRSIFTSQRSLAYTTYLRMCSRRSIRLTLAALVVCGACGGDNTGPDGTRGPARVVLSNLKATSFINYVTLAYHVKNEGGDGQYTLTFWRVPRNVPNAAIVNFAGTADEPVTYPYETNVSLDIHSVPLDWIVVNNRGSDTGAWMRTQCIAVDAARPCPSSIAPQ